MTDKNMLKLAVETYNKRHPDEDDLNFEIIHKDLKYAVKTATRDLTEKLYEIQRDWYDHHCDFSEYLDGDLSRLITYENFADLVTDAIKITNKEEKQ